MAEDSTADPADTDERPLQPYVITTPTGSRTWQAEDAEHAREQHRNAFGGDDAPGAAEEILTVRRATDSGSTG